MPQASQTPTRCHICDDHVTLDQNPNRVGWLFCPGCGLPVWMPLGKCWVRLVGSPDLRKIARSVVQVLSSKDRFQIGDDWASRSG